MARKKTLAEAEAEFRKITKTRIVPKEELNKVAGTLPAKTATVASRSNPEYAKRVLNSPDSYKPNETFSPQPKINYDAQTINAFKSGDIGGGFKSLGKSLLPGTLDVLKLPQNALLNVSSNISSALQGKGLAGIKDYANYEDYVIKNNGLNFIDKARKVNPLLGGTVSALSDIATDPTSYIGGGMINDAFKATKQGADILQSAKVGQNAIRKLKPLADSGVIDTPRPLIDRFQENFQATLKKPTNENFANFFDNYMSGNIKPREMPLNSPTTQSAVKQGTNIVGTPKMQSVANMADNVPPNNVRERGFAETVRTDPLSAPEMKQPLIDNPMTYEPFSDKKALNNANSTLNTLGADEAKRTLFTNASKSLTKDDVALAETLIRKAQSEGNYSEANALVADLAERLTNSGQASQAASMFKKMSPDGMLLYAQRTVSKANGKPITDKESKFISKTMEKIGQMADGREKDVEMARVMQLIANKIPSSWSDKAKALQIVSMLARPKTMIRNVVGNALMSGISNIKETIQAPIDMAVSAIRKSDRTSYLPNLKTQAKGFARGASNAIDDFKKGVDTYSANTQYELPSKKNMFGNKFLDKTLDIVTTGLKLGDRPFYDAAYDDALRQYMKSQKLTEATSDAVQYAEEIAREKTYQDVNAFTKSFKMFQKALNGGKKFGLGNIVMPFVKTPANITARAWDYSIGSIVDAAKQAAKWGSKDFDQRKFTDAIARGATGASAIWLGYKLKESGAITGKADENADKRAFDTATGQQPYSFKTGSGYASYDWAQPASLLIAMGANLYDDLGKSKDGAKQKQDILEVLKNTAVSGGDTLLNMSVLKGVADLAGYGGTSEGILEAAQNAPLQFIPGILGDAAKIVDGKVRSTYGKTDGEKYKNRIIAGLPVLSRKNLPPKITSTGKEIAQKNAFDVLINPANTTKDTSNNITREIGRLYKKTGNVGVFPNVLNGKLTLEGKTIQLTKEQLEKYQRSLGKSTMSEISKTISDASYRTKTYEEKAKAIKSVIEKKYDEMKKQAFKEIRGGK